MLTHSPAIDPGKLISTIVRDDYRTARVFRRHAISYCCGGRQPLQNVCAGRGLDVEELSKELVRASHTITLPPETDFATWDPIFMIDYILNIHHAYLHRTLSLTQNLLNEFVNAHAKKFPGIKKLEISFAKLVWSLEAAMITEEEEIFPYIRQLYHTYKHQEAYTGLFIRNLRKPVEELWEKGHDIISGILQSIRQLSNAYTPPDNACLNHEIVLAQLKEIDNDVAQHSWFEQTFLFPRVRIIEKELLAQASLHPQD